MLFAAIGGDHLRRVQQLRTEVQSVHDEELAALQRKYKTDNRRR
jgi:hypothetical protein